MVAIGRNAHGFEPSDSYCLPDLWSLHLFAYDATLQLGDEKFEIKPGSLSITPPGVAITTWYRGISVHLYAHFQVAPGPEIDVPKVCHTGDQYEALHADLYDAVLKFPHQPDCVNSMVWSALWKSIRFGKLESTGETSSHRAVRIVTEMIEHGLSDRLLVSNLAEKAQVSPSHLARLFQEAMGESVVGYIRRRRMERAADLLRHSTLPIKVIAASVGIGDLQQFNKAIRRAFGTSPRALRR